MYRCDLSFCSVCGIYVLKQHQPCCCLADFDGCFCVCCISWSLRQCSERADRCIMLHATYAGQNMVSRCYTLQGARKTHNAQCWFKICSLYASMKCVSLSGTQPRRTAVIATLAATWQRLAIREFRMRLSNCLALSVAASGSHFTGKRGRG